MGEKRNVCGVLVGMPVEKSTRIILKWIIEK
jgi:hypothetical protein